MNGPHGWTTSRQAVVGFDLSPQSIAALRWAASYRAGKDALLRIVHVWDLTDAELSPRLPSSPYRAQPDALAESS